MRASRSVSQMSRRLMLQSMGAGSVVFLQACGGSSSAQTPSSDPPTGGTPPQQPIPPQGSGQHPIFGADKMTRQTQALNLRELAANAQYSTDYGDQMTNGDEGLYADYRGSFSKALPHNELGEVENDAYQSLLRALESADNADFEAIPLAGARKLANPQAAYRYEMVGLDSHKTFMRPAPEFAGLETAAEMGELYWKALCRDIPFAEYGSNSLIQKAIADLNAFSATVGPKQNGKLNVDTIFRGETPGDLKGPYISQLLWKDIPYGGYLMAQKYGPSQAGDDYMTDVASWLAVQRGDAPPALDKALASYIIDARGLGEFVHQDFSYQAYLNAALILLGVPNSLDYDNIYTISETQGAFASLGGPDILNMVAKAGNLALTGAWYQKWLVHRRARPESYGGRLHFQISGDKDYGLPDDIVNSDAIARVHAQTGTYLLPQAFPEGSPTHPSYPAGHATIAGACTTVLKAYFEETAAFPDPVIPTADGSTLTGYYGETLTIGDELNKLANNIALGRDWAGVHYRSDGVDGLLVGEQQAIGLLLDYSRTYNEQFGGFTFTKFNGERIKIQNGKFV